MIRTDKTHESGNNNNSTWIETRMWKRIIIRNYCHLVIGWCGSTAKQDSALGKNLTSVKYKVITVDDISQASPGTNYPKLRNLHKYNHAGKPLLIKHYTNTTIWRFNYKKKYNKKKLNVHRTRSHFPIRRHQWPSVYRQPRHQTTASCTHKLKK